MKQLEKAKATSLVWVEYFPGLGRMYVNNLTICQIRYDILPKLRNSPHGGMNLSDFARAVRPVHRFGIVADGIAWGDVAFALDLAFFTHVKRHIRDSITWGDVAFVLTLAFLAGATRL